MKRILAIILWLLAIALWMQNHQTLTNQLSIPAPYQSLYEEVLAPVVKITSKAGTGSGVIISDTYILTAAHVVGNESEVQVTFYSYRRDAEFAEIFNGTVIITDTNKDLALLRITQDARRRVHYARLAPRDYKPYLFTEVWAVGCSLGFAPRPSSGHICAISPSPFPSHAGEGLGEGYWEISAPILPGNSGGGVFLKDTHQLIGIVVWVRTYHGQLVTTMAGVVPIQAIYDFLECIDCVNACNDTVVALHNKKTTPLMNCEEHKSEGLTCWSGRGSDGAIGTGGPAGQPYL